MTKWSLLILRSWSAKEKLEIANPKGRADGGVGGRKSARSLIFGGEIGSNFFVNTPPEVLKNEQRNHLILRQNLKTKFIKIVEPLRDSNKKHEF